jgi:hypothetical protein
MNHREERDFAIHLHLSAEFGPDYEGDDDGFAWYEDFQRRVRPKVVAAIFTALAGDPSFRAVAAPRGRDPESGLDIDVSRAKT